ncbi:leucyl aminopeptidase [Nordella sp. HKS 07]|uniref:leucyl aminopeptidase n=1 Tax=Nordella sp. HKS 07 TaxID=2712222 RepID=UPI0013E12B57|nr:leucyl aminopeptidase [Nordella sp. HKS 07]QIG50693.1 leucyl aminopeptidase [Nordella sp. HKS 07]
MHVTFAAPGQPKAGVLVVLCPEGGKLFGIAAEADKRSGGHLSRAVKAISFEAKREQILDLVAPEKLPLQRIILVGLGDPAKLVAREAELLGGVIAGYLQAGKVESASIAADVATSGLDAAEFAALLASGAALRTYSFDRYKSKKPANGKALSSLTVLTGQAAKAKKAFADYEAIAQGVHFARDLVNEPANKLNPVEFAARVKVNAKAGLAVEILTPAQMKKLGMGALLGVAQGSVNEPRLVVMRWQGGKKGDKPLAFIGKGVTFDTGGISIKPAAGMEDMKGDMGGAACVAGLMLALARRKAKVNAVGVIGLVENMPDGNAQRPGDIVTSMSGKTIAVLNTDAEGRLVLADALWYTQDRFKPKFMINLATLTGAIMVALGKEHAGLFSNNDELATRLYDQGLATGEKVWRMPLAPEYDKMLDFEVADMKNIGGRNAGAITAAQFLQRFVNNVPWVHLDVAGTAMDSNKSPINQSWGSGWGVRLLNRLVAEHYEG